jgi:hypothetical protein
MKITNNITLRKVSALAIFALLAMALIIVNLQKQFTLINTKDSVIQPATSHLEPTADPFVNRVVPN